MDRAPNASVVTPLHTRNSFRYKVPHMLPMYVADWELWQTARRLSPSTISERTRVLRQFHAEMGVQPAHAQAIDIMRWFAEHQSWSQSSYCTYYAYLNGWFKWLQNQDLRPDNPMIKIGAPKQPDRLPRPVSDADVRALLTGSSYKRTHAMITLAAFQGLRVHEIAKIRAEDINLQRESLYVKGKNAATHELPLHPRVANLAYVMPRKGYWFPAPATRPGDPVRAKSVSQAISDAMGRCGVRATPHALRHYFASRLLADGADLLTVKELLRHKNIQTTVIYAKLPDGVRSSALAKIDPWQAPEGARVA